MTLHTSIASGIFVCLLGTLLSSLVGACGRSAGAHRISQILLALSNAIGALAALAFFFADTPVLPLIHLSLLFPTTLGLDHLSALFFLIVTGMSSVTALFAIHYVESERDTYNVRSLDCIAALFVLGMQMVPLTPSVAGFMLFWEVMSIASFFLVMADRKDASIKAAFLYLTMTQLGASALLAGFFLLGDGTIFPDFAALAQHARTASDDTILFAFALLFFGFGSKAGLVPFHLWLPEAHPRAPSHISALMSGVMLKIALYGFLRTVLFLLPPLPVIAGMAVLALGLLSGLLGVLHAVVDRDIKRTLAFSSIENLGLIFTMVGLSMIARANGLSVLAELALAAALFHAVNHAIFKTGLFLCAGAIVQGTHAHSLEAMGGLAKTMPRFTVAFCSLALAASALPPFGAFFGEWMFLEGIVGTLKEGGMMLQGLLLVALAAVVLISGLAIFAMVKLFAIACLGAPRSPGAAHAKEPAALLTAPLFALAILALGMGLLSPAVLSFLSPAHVGIVASRLPTVAVATGRLSPLTAFLALAAILLVCIMLVRMAWSGRRRLSHVWDCGQEVNAGMEYTATAFSAPIRFFFRFLLHHKTVVATPVVPTNPWIVRQSMTVHADTSIRFATIYGYVARILLWLSAQAKRLQNGIVQFYLLLMFLALVLSLIIAV
ncbi:MAG: NADH dehydrogenase (quinone) [Candidatus Peregrinibacteria bacterium Gr01-1014_25]|nr:MAG: NADH dehydrogenase (quinone) [Candidatus Peregrinibacteria bacterium Gr01-1014_25]